MAKKAAVHERFPIARARASWQHASGLAGSVSGTLADVVGKTGWSRTLGGVDAYLALRARVPGLTRKAVDDDVVRGALRVAPAARACIYLVPEADLPLALRFAEERDRPRMEREHAKAGIDAREIDELGAAIRATLAKNGPLTPDALRRALPEGAVRSTGEAGKKVGISSTLPPALRALEFAGEVVRTLPGGALDSERYAWAVPSKNALRGARVPDDPAGRAAALAARFFAWAEPAPRADFAAWSGLSQRDAAAAIEALGLVPVAVDGYADEAYIAADRVAALREAEPAAGLAMLPFEDNLFALHGGARALCDPRHHAREVQGWGRGEKTTLGEARHPVYRPIVSAGTLAGFWEFDPPSGRVVACLLDPLPRAAQAALKTAAGALEAFVRDQLGHARSFSLDTDAELAGRASLLQKGL